MTDSNTGHYNTGHCNTGDFNTGNRNTGHYNTGHYNTGFFNTTTPATVTAFNNTQVDRQRFIDAAPDWLWNVAPAVWVPAEAMTLEQKAAHPEHATTGGFLRERTWKDAWAVAWENSDKDVAAVEAMPGFDRDVWLEITGLDLWGDTPAASVVVDGVRYVREDLS